MRRSSVFCLVIVLLALAGFTGQAAAQLDADASLSDAVRAGNIEAVRAILADGVNVDTPEADGATALHWAVRSGNREIAQLLIDNGAYVRVENRYGVAPLYLAALAADAGMIEMLLAAGADPMTTLPEGETVLMTASRTGNVDAVEVLLDAGADPNQREGWHAQTALMWAAAENHADVVTALAEAGAELEARSVPVDLPTVLPDERQGGFVYPQYNKGGMNALLFAARQGSLEAVQALIDAAIGDFVAGDPVADALAGIVDDPRDFLNLADYEGATPLILATLNGHFDVTGLLLDSGADPNVADERGRTVLFLAVDMHTLDFNPRPAPKPHSTLSSLDIVEMALEAGADVNATLERGLPAWVAQGGGHNPMLKKGATAFFRASMSGDLPVMRMLLDAEADAALGIPEQEEREGPPVGFGPRTTYGNTTPLMAAAGVGWRDLVSRGRDADAIEAIKLLIELEQDVNAVNQDGNTALHGATMRRSPSIIQFLVDQGADMMVKNKKGRTPLDIAMGDPEDRIPYVEETETLLRELMIKELSVSN